MRYVSLLLAVVLLFAGCDTSPSSQSGASTVEPSASSGSDTITTSEKTFGWVSNSEDNTVNPHDAAARGNYELVDLLQTSLYYWEISEDGERVYPAPSLAASEPVTEDNTTFTIKIHPDAKWSDGVQITADDFIYSWQMALNPTLSWSATTSLATQYINVNNALDYYKGTVTDWAEVGMSAPDSETLVITTNGKYTVEEVMRHFTQRSTSPVREDIYEASMSADGTVNSYGSDLSKFIGCGQFKLESWTKGSEAVLVKNEYFIHSDSVHITEINRRVVLEEQTTMQLFETGESDFVYLSAASLDTYEQDPRLMSYNGKAIKSIEFNRSHPDKPYLADPDFRKAIYYAIDRESAAQLTDTTPAHYFLSTEGYIFADGTAYRSAEGTNDWLPENYGYNPDEAKALFDSILAKYSLDSIELQLIYNEGMAGVRPLSEYLQSELPKIFGEDKFSLTLQAVPNSVDVMKTTVETPGDDWDLAWSALGLAAETFKPYAKFDRYTSTNPSRYTNYQNAFLDENYSKFSLDEYRFDEEKLLQLTIDAEKSIILDDMTVVPIVQDRYFMLFSDRVQLPTDTYVSSVGFGWSYAEIDTAK